MKANETREHKGIRFTKRFSSLGRNPRTGCKGSYRYFINDRDWGVNGAERERALADMQGIDEIKPCGVAYSQGVADTIDEIKTIIDKNLEALQVRKAKGIA